jgi:cardiolipin synthase (CMP-forming)
LDYLRPPLSPNLTIPNIITMVRILATPLFIISLMQESYGRALGIFILAGFSDLADGLIARNWHQKSPLGAFLDPLADKLLLASSFLTLGIWHKIPAWLVVTVISRDFVIMGGILILKLFDVKVKIQPSLASKWTTSLQILVVFLVLLRELWVFPLIFLTGSYWLTALLTVATGIHYLSQGVQMFNGQQEEKKQGGKKGKKV